MKSRVVSVCLFIILAASACSTSGDQIDNGIVLKSLDGSEINLDDRLGQKGTVLVFLIPECPLCVNYTRTLTDLRTTFPDPAIKFIMVFSGTYYKQEEIEKFMNENNFHLEYLEDTGLILAHALNIEIAPSSVLLNSDKEIIYRGAI